MKAIPEQQILSWLSERHLDVGDHYPEKVSVLFKDDFSRFWVVPQEPANRPHLIDTILSLTEAWSECLVWKPDGSWMESTEDSRTNDVVLLQLLRGLGLPLGTADGVLFQHSERMKLVSLAFLTTIFGWCKGDDMLIIPDSGLFIVKVSHHDVIHVACKSEAAMNKFVAGMKKRGFPLPEEPPDPTFKIPKWMRR